MKLNPQDLEKIADLTLKHYNQSAEDFREGTRDHDVSQNIEALLQYAVGLEGAARFDVMARVQQPWLASVWRRLAS
jgi:hypothetical protein